MANPLLSFTFFFLFFVLLTTHDFTYSPTFPIPINNDRQSQRKFNIHEKINIPDAIAIKAVANPGGSCPFALELDITSINKNDDALTDGPDPNLKLFSHPRGFYYMSSTEGSYPYFTIHVIFTDGSQSSVVIMGRDLIIEKVMELPVKGSNIIRRKISHTSQSILHIALTQRKIFLNNLPHVSFISHNLIFNQKLTSKNNSSTSINARFTIEDLSTKQTLLQGISQNKFYPQPPISPIAQFNTLPAQQHKPLLWQAHLGHPYIVVLAILVKSYKITYNQCTPLLCTSCNVAERNNLSFMPINFSTSKPLKLVHVGVWGPSIVPSFNGYQYYIIFVDEFLRFCLLFHIHGKSNTFLIFIYFSLMAENTLNLLPKTNSILLSTNKHFHNPISPTPHLNLAFPTTTLPSHIPNSNIFTSITPIPSPPPPPINIHPMITHLKFDNLKQEHIFPLVENHQTIITPSSFSQAFEALELHHAMSNEFIALLKQGTWSLIPPAPHHHVLNCRWTYKTRVKPNGSINLHKALLTAQGFQQEYDFDYCKMLSMVAKMPTIRLLPTISLHNNWSNHQLHVSNVILYGKLQEDAYISLLLGFIDTTTKDVVLFIDAYILHH